MQMDDIRIYFNQMPIVYQWVYSQYIVHCIPVSTLYIVYLSVHCTVYTSQYE